VLIVHTGNRIDEADRDPPRFPPEHAADIGHRLELLFRALRPDRLVSAAAAGADLLALEAAFAAGVPTTIALPLLRDEFRRRSVEDQGGDWVSRYDAALARAREVVEHDLSDRDDWYLEGNEVILDEAARLRDGGDVIVVAVRAGSASASDDLVERAAARGWASIDLDPSIDPSSRPLAVVVRRPDAAVDPACIAALVDLDLDWEGIESDGRGGWPTDVGSTAAVVIAEGADVGPRSAPTVAPPASGDLMERVAALRDRIAAVLGP